MLMMELFLGLRHGNPPPPPPLSPRPHHHHQVGGQLFRLEVYPAGLSAQGHKYLGLFLTTPGSTRPGHLLYELSVIDKVRLGGEVGF